jgi:hypothetical protein
VLGVKKKVHELLERSSTEITEGGASHAEIIGAGGWGRKKGLPREVLSKRVRGREAEGEERKGDRRTTRMVIDGEWS